MKSRNKYQISKAKIYVASALVCVFFSFVWARPAFIAPAFKSFAPNFLLADSDTILHYPFKDRVADEQSTKGSKSGMYLHDPANISKSVEYNTDDNQYEIKEGIGKLYYRNPNYLTFDEFKEKEFKNSQRNYFMKRSDEESVVKKSALIPQLHVNGEVFDRIFGGNTVDIRPNGSAELIFGLRRSTNENPSLPIRSQKPPPQFDFDQKIQMNVVGKIGDKMRITTSYNTESQFDFENQMKIEYTGYEDEIIKKIELGNVSLPLTGSLITGSQSLFGVKTALQFGRLTVTSIYSQQKGKKQSVESQGGAQTSFYEVKADQYEANKHFFLSQYFKDHYDQWLAQIPEIKSPINITRVEVWVTKKQGNVDNIRNVLGLMDLGELHYFDTLGDIHRGTLSSGLPDNDANDLYKKLYKNASVRDINTVNGVLNSATFQNARDFEKLEARLLPSSEFTLSTKLGYISLNQALNPNEVLAVAYEYTVGGKTYRVGEFSNGGISAPSVLIVKLLKGTLFTTKLPTWDLMMKNIYNIGAFQVKKEDFKLQVMYNNASTGIPITYLPAGTTEPAINGIRLIKVFNLDKLNSASDPIPDGDFDFLEGVTINADKGRIIFPVREPFGAYLRTKFNDQSIANKYAYDFLYDSTRTRASQDLEHNRFSLKGSYKSTSTSEINLNAFNIPQGSVTVTAGGVKLVENTDYTVDYNLGKVKIINGAYLNSNTPIKVDLESNSMFNLQQKTLFGTRLDYYINKDLTVGGTMLHLKERPITQKVNIGDESISNTIWGLDGTYKKSSRFLTKMVDALPLYSTKEPSNVTVSGEYARLMPGHSKDIGADNGTAYIDDFEGTKSTIDIKTGNAWTLASVPQGQPLLFPEAGLPPDTAIVSGNLKSGFNRSKLAWYIIDPFFYDNQAPDNIKNNSAQLSDPYSRQVFESEIFPNKQNANGQTAQNLAILNLAYYPKDRGPYNYDVGPTNISKGMNPDGSLKNPESRWAGVMRKMETTDFEATNIEFIEFWMMDPFIKSTTSGGDLYFNLGSISEDILKDGIKSLENGLPTVDIQYPAPVDNKNISDQISVWGRVPLVQPIVNAFDNNPTSRPFQDVGLDGFDDANERTFFANYVAANPNATDDPSNDDYHHFRGSDYDNEGLSILDRYKKYNGMEGNSKATSSSDPYPTTATTLPDMEDINRDGQFNENESYYQYKVSIKPGAMAQVGENYITDIITATVKLPNNQTETVKWYQFKIPIATPKAEKIGGIEDFHSIGFVRMFMKGFSDTVICRFAKLQLVRSDWRRYPNDVPAKANFLPTDNDKSIFDVSSVSIEENGSGGNVHYVLPPGIERQKNATSTTLQLLNEQSIVLRACNLEDGHGRATYKNINFDIRNYKKIRMYLHAEAGSPTDKLNDGDVTAFIRLGNDFTSNYYEYEIPLTVTPFGAVDPNVVWPAGNDMVLDLDKLYNAKVARNAADWPLDQAYPVPDGDRLITVVGSPRLNEIKTIMIGIRNPFRYKITDKDDGLPKCAEIWVDELRVTDFDDSGGWAANARVNAKLADLGSVNLTGVHKSYNWGTLEQKLNERAKNNENTYDASANAELGKFVPDKVKMSIPMFVDFSETWKRPKYDPNEPDVPYQEEISYLKDHNSKKVVKEFIHKTEDYTERRSINFTNVRKVKGAGKKSSHFYDIENVSLTAAYTDLYNRTEVIQYKYQKTYRGGVAYVYSLSPKSVTPFGKVKAVQSNWLKLIKDINFSYVPSSFSFRTDFDRQYNESMLRNTTGEPYQQDTAVNKLFTVSRLYDVKYDPTKSLKLDFQAVNSSRIDERPGRINKKDGDYKADVDTIKDNLYRKTLGGRTTDYHHGGNVNYAIPINKIPVLDWITSTAKYGYDYHWQTAPMILDSLRDENKNVLYDEFGHVKGLKLIPDQSIGNSITNSQTRQLTTNFNFVSLYNKIGYLKRVNQKKPGSVFPKKLKPPVTRLDSIRAKNDSIFHASIPGVAVQSFFKVLMMVRTGGVTYSETYGTMLPGYLPRTQILGMDEVLNPNNRYSMAPTPRFVFGEQMNIDQVAGRNGWLTPDTTLNLPYTKTHVQTLTAKTSLEPFTGMKIDLNASRNFSKNRTSYYHYGYDDQTGEIHYHSAPAIETGNFSMSYISILTHFEKQTAKDFYKSKSFEDFKSERLTISTRLAAQQGFPADTTYHGAKDDSLGYYKGYSAVSQEVLIPAFLGAYSGQGAFKVPIGTGKKDRNIFPIIPLPNWRATYDGLSKYDFSKKYFSTITLSHAYRSTYNINSFTTSTKYIPDNSAVNDTGDFRSKYEIGQVSIAEAFTPLIGLDATWKMGLTSKLEYKRDRNISLSLANTQVNETHGKEYVIGAGYRYKQFKIPFMIGGRTVRLKNDLVFKADFSIRKSLTITRKLTGEDPQPTGGMTNKKISASIEYMVNERFNLKLFYDRSRNIPELSNSFKTTTWNAGFSVRFLLNG